LAIETDFVALGTSFSLHTLRDGLSLINNRISSISALFNSLAITSIALFTSWPACSNGTLVEGSLDKMEMMSVVAYSRKSNNFTEGNGILYGKNSTVLEFTMDFALEM